MTDAYCQVHPCHTVNGNTMREKEAISPNPVHHTVIYIIDNPLHQRLGDAVERL